jgi:hypothetical protein
MKHETKFDLVVAIVLAAILLALFSMSPHIPKPGILGFLYFSAALADGVLLGLVINRIRK